MAFYHSIVVQWMLHVTACWVAGCRLRKTNVMYALLYAPQQCLLVRGTSALFPQCHAIVAYNCLSISEYLFPVFCASSLCHAVNTTASKRYLRLCIELVNVRDAVVSQELEESNGLPWAHPGPAANNFQRIISHSTEQMTLLLQTVD